VDSFAKGNESLGFVDNRPVDLVPAHDPSDIGTVYAKNDGMTMQNLARNVNNGVAE
jgi:hypothetical protein